MLMGSSLPGKKHDIVDESTPISLNRKRRRHKPCVGLTPLAKIPGEQLLTAIVLVFTAVNVLYHAFDFNFSVGVADVITERSILEECNNCATIPRVRNQSRSKVDALSSFGDRLNPRRKRKAYGTTVEPRNEIVVFYNVYIPMEESRREAASRIVFEQIHQITRSYAATRNASVDLRYNTIGHTLGTKIVNRACSRSDSIDCRHLKHYEDGNFEDVTLTEIHNYCLAKDETTVVYLHSKGTYHPSEMNDHWRRYMTRAALSRECLINVAAREHNMGSANTCTVCGFNFNPIWTPAFFGNIWTADCGYVRRLMPPSTFKAQSNSTAERAMELMRQGRFTMNLLTPFLEEAGHLGRSRFADEHWVGSHPSLVPCDMAPYPHLMKWIHPSFGENRVKMPMKWSLAPRRPVDDDWIFLEGIDKRIRMVKNRDWRALEFFLLKGALWKWLTWYNELPPSSSYVWKWFPDGAEWLERIRAVGESASEVKRILEKDSFVEQEHQQLSAWTAPVKPSSRVFFLHIKTPESEELISNFLKGFRRRLHAISDGSPGATVFYSVVGKLDMIEPESVRKICRRAFHMDCRLMESTTTGMDTLTLSRVYQYCSDKGTAHVGYTTFDETQLHDNGISMSGLSFEQTKVIASDDCWTNTSTTLCELCSRQPVVNVKKTRMQKPEPIPPIWKATCEYIRSLDPPNEFAAKMSEVHWPLGLSFGKRWIMSAPKVRHCRVQANRLEVEEVANIGRTSKKDAPILSPLNSWVSEQ